VSKTRNKSISVTSAKIDVFLKVSSAKPKKDIYFCPFLAKSNFGGETAAAGRKIFGYIINMIVIVYRHIHACVYTK
jgi:hypothetical protein